MLITLLTPFLGILGSLLPSIVRMFERKQEMKYEIELTKVKLEAALQEAQIQVDIKNIEADITDSESVRNYDNGPSDSKFINALKSSIRPVITYCFFALFVAVKVAAAYVMLSSGQSVPEMLKAVWDQDTMALFGTIMAFWFGARVLEKMGYGGMRDYGKLTVVPVKAKDPQKATQKKP